MRRFDVQIAPLSDDGGAIVGSSVTFVDVSNEQ
jgi:hypothetical protein